jgi:uncharacterized protein
MDEYTESIIKFRREREARLVASPRNWLSLCGLFWLKPGRNSLGADPDCDICLTGLPLPRCADLLLADGRITLDPVVDSGLRINGQPAAQVELETDQSEQPDLLESGSLAMMVIIRGEHTLLRVWDQSAPAYVNFHGLNYFPVDARYRISAEYQPYDPPKTIQTFDAIGTPTETEFKGRVVFELDGQPCSLDVEVEDGEMMLNFNDLSAKTGSYPGGRFLVCDQPAGTHVELDFNRTVNWPCAYTSFATCPVPPAQNRLTVAISAGEMRFHE